uniref:Uncharacterized protein ORF SG34 n=1 Tax=Pseudomonas aeruginosa TaxID=287 RepID=Q8GPW8_PSEAI|nr:hypothetical protein [Pseudomonas aeruginosa]
MNTLQTGQIPRPALLVLAIYLDIPIYSLAQPLFILILHLEYFDQRPDASFNLFTESIISV